VEGRQRLTIASAVATRAATGGMLTTALAVFVGRQGSAFAVSLLSTAFFFNTMVFTPLWGALGDLTGRRQSLTLALSALATASIPAFLLVDSVWGLIGVRGLYSFFAVGFAPLMLAIVGDVEGRAHRGRAAGFFTGSFAAGDVGAQLLVGALLGALAPSELFAVVAAVSLAGTLLLARVDDSAARPEGSDAADSGDTVPQADEAPTDDSREDEAPTDGPRKDEAGAREPRRGDPHADGGLSLSAVWADARRRLVPPPAERRVLRESGLTWLFVGLAVRHMSVKGIGSLVPIYLLTRVGTSEFTMGALLTVGSATQIAFTNRFGRAADGTVGNRKELVVGGALVSGLYGLLLASATLPASHVLRLAVAAAGFVTVAAGFSALEVGTITIIGGAVPPSRESAFLGLRATAAGVGGVIGPMLVGALAVTAGYRTAFSAAASLAFLAAGLLASRLRIPERPGSTEASHPMVETAVGLSHPIVHAVGRRVGRSRRGPETDDRGRDR
jgi:MFS family permease